MMFGFNQLFSQFGFQQPNIDPILERAEGIDDILDEDNILTCVKSSTGMQKFGDYIRKHPDMIQKLIKYLIEEPDFYEQMDQKRCFKYPFISSELFSCEIPLLINSLFDDLRMANTAKNYDSDDNDDFVGLRRNNNKPENDNNSEQIIEKINVNCEDEDDQANEFLENNSNPDNFIDKYVDEVISNVVNKLQAQNSNKKSDEFKSCNSSLNEDTNVNNITNQNNEIVGIKLMEYLLSFVQDKNELNETSAGYWAKAITAIINKKGTDFMDYQVEIENGQNSFFDQILNFISCRSIADIILKLVLLEIPSLEAKKMLYYVSFFIFFLTLIQSQRTYIVRKLFEKLCASQSTYVKIIFIYNVQKELENISYVLCEIFNKYQNQYNGSQELVEFILTEENLKLIFKNIIDQKDSAIYFYSLKIIQSIYKFFNQPEEKENVPSQFLTSPDKNDEEIKQNLQQLQSDSKISQCFLQILPQLISKLEQDSNIEEISLQLQTVKPFGLGKLKLLEILYFGLKSLIQVNQEEIRQSLKKTKFFSIILDLIEKYEWNNFLHTQVQQILILILKSNTIIKEELFSSSCNFQQRIIENLSNIYFILSPNRRFRTTHGNIMIFLKLANELLELKEKDDELIKNKLNNEKWEQFENDILSKINKEMKENLGGVNPREKKSVIQENEREIDLANIFKKFSAFFASTGNTNPVVRNNDNDYKKEDEEEQDDDNDYNQLNKKYQDEEDDDDFNNGDENNEDPNEENNAEPQEKMSLQKLKLQQLTAGGQSSVTSILSKAKHERNAAYAAYSLQKKNNLEDEDDEDNDEQDSTNQFKKNLEQFKLKQERLLKEINNKVEVEPDSQENQISKDEKFNSYQYWEQDQYKLMELSSEMIDEVL